MWLSLVTHHSLLSLSSQQTCGSAATVRYGSATACAGKESPHCLLKGHHSAEMILQDVKPAAWDVGKCVPVPRCPAEGLTSPEDKTLVRI